MHRSIVRTAILAALAWAAGTPPAGGAAPPFDLTEAATIAAGESLFNRRCAGKCHGLDGHAGEDAPTIRGKEYLTPVFVYITVTMGRPGSAMPSWKDRLTEDELWRVVAYVVSLR
jgi:mono/diheme cytochrome c family protein